MATKASEMMEELDAELRRIDTALIQARSLNKSLESARDTLKYFKNWLQHGVRESTDNSRCECGRHVVRIGFQTCSSGRFDICERITR